MLDDATLELLRLLGDQPNLNELTVKEARMADARLALLQPSGPKMARVDAVDLRSATAQIYVPHGKPVGIVIYVHGGGWVLGHLNQYDTLARILAAESGCVVVMAGYRKAPEHPFPAGLEDVWKVAQWTSAHREEIAGSLVPLVIAGDSAGGNLAAVVARRARDTGSPDLALQVLVYPVTDCTFSTSSYLDPANAEMLTREGMEWFWDLYIPETGERHHPDASPLRARHLGGLAPAVVITAEHDVLRDEGNAYADRLRADGVEVTHSEFAGQMHGFFTFADLLPAGHEAIALVVRSIREAIGVKARGSVPTA